MDFIYYLILIASVLLLSHRRLEVFVFNYERNSHRSTYKSESDRIVMTIGDILTNSSGIAQYQQLKPQLEQAKAYYQKAHNESIRMRYQYREPVVETSYNPQLFR